MKKENEDKETVRYSDVDIDELDGTDVETIAYASDKNDDNYIVDIEIIDVLPLHQRERLKRQQQKRDEYNKKKFNRGCESVDDNDDNVQLTDVRPLHPSKRLRLYNKQRALKSIGDDEDDV